jgi:hypothetical protein
MTSAEYEIIDAVWPENVPATTKAIRDFIATNKKVAEITGDKEFLVNVRRTAKSKQEFRDVVEVTVKDGRLWIRRTDTNGE